MDTSEKNKRIAKNTGLLYLRSIVCFVLSLYSSRLILQALGVEDYGIYNAVGGFVSMFWTISSTLSSAIGRFLNVEMGQKNQKGVNEVFSMSLNIMFLLAILAAVIAEVGGMWFISEKMTIPLDKVGVAKLIFHLSVLTMLFGFISIPYGASIIAHEKLGFVAFLNITEAVLKLVIAIILTVGVHSSDKLSAYAILLTFSSVLVYVLTIIYAARSFQECRVRWIMRWNKLWEMFRFAWWNFVDSISSTFSGQGVNMILNVSHGPILNTARGLTNTVTQSVSMLVYNFNVSMNPQVTQSYAAGDIKRVKNLAFRGTRFASFMMLFFLIPLVLETHFTLRLWLGQVPEHTVTFIRLSMIASFLYLFDYMFVTVKLATGDIRTYKIIVSVLTFMNFPLAYLILKGGLEPEWIYLIPILVASSKTVVTLFSVRNQLDLTFKEVFKGIYFPICFVSALSAIPPLILYIFMTEGWVRFGLTVGISVLSTGCCVFFIGCQREERIMFMELLRSFLKLR